NIEAAEEAGTFENPLHGTLEPENWNLVNIDDGTYYIAEYIGVVDNPSRTEEQTEVEGKLLWKGHASNYTPVYFPWDGDIANTFIDLTAAEPVLDGVYGRKENQ
ncbi:MAG: hypothetical protein IIY74_01905, partial [Firmicutes bacterium]|nr:hypothetical protein [Bacillota bacterium]